jgi:hypothetical protein
MIEKLNWKERVVTNVVTILITGLLVEIKTDIRADRKAQDILIEIYVKDLERMQGRIEQLEEKLGRDRKHISYNPPPPLKPIPKYEQIKNRLDKHRFEYIQQKAVK